MWCLLCLAIALVAEARRLAPGVTDSCRDLDFTGVDKAVSDVLTLFEQRHQKLLKKKNLAAAVPEPSQQAGRSAAIAGRLVKDVCNVAEQVGELQDKIGSKLPIARSDVELPFQWPSKHWQSIFTGSDRRAIRQSSKVLKYVHLSLVLTYKIRQAAMVELQKAAVFPEGNVDVVTDDLFVVTSAAYGLLHQAMEQGGHKGGLCEVLDKGDAFGDAFHRFAQEVDVVPLAKFMPSPLDRVLGETAFQVLRGEVPQPGRCKSEQPRCQLAAEMFCPYCLRSDHLEAEYWFFLDMMGATVMNALSDALDASSRLDSLSESCRDFFGPRLMPRSRA